MRPKDGDLREAYDLIESYLTQNPPEMIMSKDDRLTPPLRTSVFVSFLVTIRVQGSSYSIHGCVSERKGWLLTEELLYTDFGDDIISLERELLKPILDTEDPRDRVIALGQSLNERNESNYQLLLDIYCTEVR